MIAPEIIYEDNHLLALNKPAGMLSQDDETGDLCAVDWAKDYVKRHYNKPGAVFMGLPHRLDRPVSGVLLLAKTSKALVRLNEAFKKREVRKTYLAITIKQPQDIDGELVHYLRKDQKKVMTTAFKEPKHDAQEARLHYHWLGDVPEGSLLQVEPHTGRPHQIRAQLSAMGAPIRGDLKYGAKTPERDQRILLHAYLLTIEHPVKKEPLQLKAPLPLVSGWKNADQWLDDELQPLS